MFVTNTLPGETDILTGNENKPLVVFDNYVSDTQPAMMFEPPKGGWTFARMMAMLPSIESRTDYWDAYLSDNPENCGSTEWVGGSEI